MSGHQNDVVQPGAHDLIGDVQMSGVISVVFGTISTLVLVFVFGPAMLLMNEEALRLARKSLGQGTEFDARNWIVAVLGPLLTGPIPELLRFAG